MPNSRFSITAVLGVDSSSLREGLKNVNSEVDSWAATFEAKLIGGAKRAAMGVASALAGLTMASAKEYSDFEQQFLQLLTVLPNLAAGAADAIKQQIFGISKQFGIMPAEVARAFYEAVSSGFSLTQSIQMVKDAQNFAIGTNADYAESFKLMVNTMVAFRATGITSTKVMDIFTQAVVTGQLRGADLVATFHNLNAVTANTGISFEESAAALAQLTQNGVPAAEAATQIRSAILSMTAAEKEHQEAIVLHVGAIDGSIKTYQDFKNVLARKPDGLIQAMNLLANASRDATGKVDMEPLKRMIGRIEGMQAILNLTTDSGVKFQQTLAAMGASAGVAARAFAIMDESILRNWQRMRSELSVAMINYFEALRPALLTLLDPIWRMAQGLIDGIDWKAFSAKAVAAAQWLVANLMPIIQTLVDRFKQFDWAGFWKDIQPLVKDAIGLAGQLISKLGELMPVLAPLLTKYLLTHMAGILRAGLFIVKVLDSMKESLGAAANSWIELGNAANKAFFEPTEENFRSLVRWAGRSFKDILNFAKDAASQFTEQVMGKIAAVAESWFGAEAGGVIGNFFKRIGHDLTSMFGNVVDSIGDLVGGLFGQIKTWVSDFGDYIENEWQENKALIQPMLDWVLNGFNDIKEAVLRGTQAVTRFMLAAFEAIGSAVKAIWSIAKPIVYLVGGALAGIFRVLSWITKQLVELASVLIDAVTYGIKLVTGALDTMATNINNLFDDFSEWVGAIWQLLKEFWGWISNASKKLFSEIIQWFADMWKEFKQVLTDMKQDIKDKFGWIIEAIELVGNTIMEIFLGLFDKVDKMLGGFLSKGLKMMKEALGWIGDQIKAVFGWVGGLFSGIGGLISSTWGKVKGFFSSTKKEVQQTASEIKKVEKATKDAVKASKEMAEIQLEVAKATKKGGDEAARRLETMKETAAVAAIEARAAFAAANSDGERAAAKIKMLAADKAYLAVTEAQGVVEAENQKKKAAALQYEAEMGAKLKAGLIVKLDAEKQLIDHLERQAATMGAIEKQTSGINKKIKDARTNEISLASQLKRIEDGVTEARQEQSIERKKSLKEDEEIIFRQTDLLREQGEVEKENTEIIGKHVSIGSQQAAQNVVAIEQAREAVKLGTATQAQRDFLLASKKKEIELQHVLELEAAKARRQEIIDDTPTGREKAAQKAAAEAAKAQKEYTTLQTKAAAAEEAARRAIANAHQQDMESRMAAQRALMALQKAQVKQTQEAWQAFLSLQVSSKAQLNQAQNAAATAQTATQAATAATAAAKAGVKPPPAAVPPPIPVHPNAPVVPVQPPMARGEGHDCIGVFACGGRPIPVNIMLATNGGFLQAMHVLYSMDNSLKRIDWALRGKFINQP